MRLIFILLLISYEATCQSILDSLTRREKRNYTSISYKSRRVPSAISTDLSLLASHLTKEARTDLEKARSFYVWIATNINYDFKSFDQGDYPSQKAEVVIARRTALCQGYANLFQALCTEAGLKSNIISGYSKGFGYKPGMDFTMSDHAWNTVKIENKWYLLDVTWGSANQDMVPYNDQYFLTEPEDFVVDHLPLDPLWQFLNNPLALKIFQKSEAEIKTFLIQKEGNFNYPDSLRKWEQTGESEARIESHIRSISFNPKNKRAVYRLGAELLFKALDLMDGIHEVEYEGFESSVDSMRMEMFGLLNEAAFHFANIPGDHPDFESAYKLIEEVTYQKGVFYYEVGQRVYDIFLEMDHDTFFANIEKGIQQIDTYYDLSSYYFSLVDKDSRYYDKAKEYIDEYIEDKNPLIPRN